MAMSPAQRRKLDRDRKAALRAEAAAEGKPARIEQVYAAVVEAASFALEAGDKRAWIRGTGWAPVNMSVIIEVAVDILTVRHQHAPAHARAAVLAALGPRPAHGLSTFVPSRCPDPGLPRYNTSAPDAAIVRTRSTGTPVTSSGTVG